ncbi:MAG: DUF541 domain-containing protein [Sphingomonadales bacterium]|nr:MAG: DUF541 domain-containing protein [Sphingomonadales bacterium]
MRSALLLVLLVAAPIPAFAQSRDMVSQGITVSGSAKIESAPDMATIAFTIRGEGATPDAASTDLAKRQRAVIGGLASLDASLRIHTGSVATNEVRRGDCAGTPGASMRALSINLDAAMSDDTDKGPCRVAGYIAAIEATAEMSAVKEAGTAVGLAQRLGASSASLEGFALRDPEAASRAALAAAITDARIQAQALAAGSGSKLGRIVSILGMPEREYAMSSIVLAEPPAYMPMVMAAPVNIDIAPKPVETSARVMIVYALID